MGSFVCHDARLDVFIRTAWRVGLGGFADSSAELTNYEEIPGRPYREDDAEAPLPCDFGPDPETGDGWERIECDRLPLAVRNMLYRNFVSGEENELLRQAAATGLRTSAFLARARRNLAEAPAAVISGSIAHFEFEAGQSLQADLAGLSFTEASADALRLPLERARGLGLNPDTSALSRWLSLSALEMLAWLAGFAKPGWLAARTVRRLDDGDEWTAPVADRNLSSAYPEAGGFQLALGKGLARLRARLEEAESNQAGLMLTPLPELLSYAERAGLSLSEDTRLTCEFWDFLDEELPASVGVDQRSILSGEPGARLWRTGRILGFADEALKKRLS